jgi:hypothetical protein
VDRHIRGQEAPVAELWEVDKVHLLPFPKQDYPACETRPVKANSYSQVVFETNRYSVPSPYVERACEVFAYPDHLDMMVKGNRIASHQRRLGRKEKIEDPTHRERLLRMTPLFKSQRIHQLMDQMDPALHHFLQQAEQEGQNTLDMAYTFFKLLKHVSKAMLLSSVREANRTGTFKIRYVQSLLQVPQPQPPNPVFPQETKLLDIDYERRSLKDYDDLL